MRRIFHTVLVLLVITALVAPLSASDAAARTPICCLGKGEHHCLGEMHAPDGAAPFGLSKATEKCPYLPLALAAMHGPDLTPAIGAYAVFPVTQSSPVVLGTIHPATDFVLHARPQRGPPLSPLD
jgi:hypothetical protein